MNEEEYETKIVQLEFMHEELEGEHHLYVTILFAICLHLYLHNWYVTIIVPVVLYFGLRKFIAKKLFTGDLPAIDSDNSEGEPDEETLNKYAQDTRRVQTLCQLAEMHIRYFDEEYEVNKFNERLTEAIAIARDISDEFYQASALGFAIKLCHKAGRTDQELQLRSEIKDTDLLELVTQTNSEEKE